MLKINNGLEKKKLQKIIIWSLDRVIYIQSDILVFLYDNRQHETDEFRNWSCFFQ